MALTQTGYSRPGGVLASQQATIDLVTGEPRLYKVKDELWLSHRVSLTKAIVID